MSESLVAELREALADAVDCIQQNVDTPGTEFTTSTECLPLKDFVERWIALLAKQEAPTPPAPIDQSVRQAPEITEAWELQNSLSTESFLPQGKAAAPVTQPEPPEQTVLIVGESAIRAHAIKKIIEGDYKVAAAPVTQPERTLHDALDWMDAALGLCFYGLGAGYANHQAPHVKRNDCIRWYPYPEPTPYQQFANELRDYKFTDTEIPESDVRPAESASHVEAEPPSELIAKFSDLAVEMEKHSNDHLHEPHNHIAASVEGICADRIKAILKTVSQAAGPELSATEMRERCADECDGAQRDRFESGLTPEETRKWNKWTCELGDAIRKLSTRRG